MTGSDGRLLAIGYRLYSKNRPATQGMMTQQVCILVLNELIRFEETPRNAGDDDYAAYVSP